MVNASVLQPGNYFFFFSSFAGSAVSDFSFVMSTGGCGGFLASVRAWGVTGQQQHGSVVSAEEIERGGAGGGCRAFGGGTKPGSSEPSPAKTVPMHNVVATRAIPAVIAV
jgi:hypothetical protein